MNKKLIKFIQLSTMVVGAEMSCFRFLTHCIQLQVTVVSAWGWDEVWEDVIVPVQNGDFPQIFFEV